MSKLSRNYYEKVRKDIRTRYLAGESVPGIAQHYEINARTVYYYLKDVTPEEKGLHIKNNYLQKLENKQNGSKEKNKKNRKKRITAKDIRPKNPGAYEYDPGVAYIVRSPGTALDPEQFVTDEPDSSSDASTTEASLADFIG